MDECLFWIEYYWHFSFSCIFIDSFSLFSKFVRLYSSNAREDSEGLEIGIQLKDKSSLFIGPPNQPNPFTAILTHCGLLKPQGFLVNISPGNGLLPDSTNPIPNYYN